MAAKTYALNKYDNKFINDLLLAGVPDKSVTSWIDNWQTKAPTYNAKADYMNEMYKAASKNSYVDANALLNAAGTWAQSYNPDLINPDTKKPYGLADFKNAVTQGSLGDASPDATTQKVLAQIQKARTLQGETIAASLGNDLTGAQTTASAKTIMAGTAAEPFNPDAIHTQYINAAGDYAVKPDDTAATLEARYGGLKNSSGKPLFTPANFKDIIAGGSDTKVAFNDKIKSYVDNIITATNGDLANTKGSLAYTTAANALLNDPSKLADSYNSNVAKLTKDATTGDWSKTTTTTTPSGDTPPSGVTGLLPKGSFKDANGNFAYTGGEIEPDKMTEFTQSYNPNKGVYRAPSLDASGKLVANSTSPYSNILNGMLSGYKNPYAADYTNQLTMPQTPDLTNIKKSFENNPTSKDLLKLANTAGQPYDPNAQTSLSPALSKIYQPSITNSAGKATKPGAPDTTNTTLPVVPKAGEPIVTDTSAGKVVNPPVKTAAELAAEKAEADRLAEVNRLAAEKTEAERQAGIKTLAEKAEAERLAEVNRLAAEKAEAERLAAEKAAVVTTPGKLTFQPVDGVVVSAEERAKNLEAARIAQEALAKRQAEEKAAAEQAGLVALANQQAADIAAADAAEWEYNSNKAREETAAWEARQKAEAERQAEVNRLAALARNPDGGPSSLAPSNNITSGPQQVTLDPNTVALSNSPSVIAANKAAGEQATVVPYPTSVVPSVSAGTNFTGMSNNLGPQQVTLDPNTVVSSPSGINALSAQTVALPPSGPQPINPSNGGPTSAVTVNPSNAGIVGTIDPSTLSVSNMNSNAGGLPSLMGPVAPAVQASAVPSTVSSLPKYNAPAQTVINAGTTQVLDSSGTPIPGRRRLGFA